MGFSVVTGDRQQYWTKLAGVDGVGARAWRRARCQASALASHDRRTETDVGYPLLFGDHRARLDGIFWNYLTKSMI